MTDIEYLVTFICNRMRPNQEIKKLYWDYKMSVKEIKGIQAFGLNKFYDTYRIVNIVMKIKERNGKK